MSHPLPQLPTLHTPFSRKSTNDLDDDDLGLANNAPVVQTVPSLWGIPLKYISYVPFSSDQSAMHHYASF